MNSALAKLKWRAEFLLNPREYVSRNWNQEAFVTGPGFFTEGMTLPPDATILDPGANLGTSAILLSELLGPDGMIYSFEPVFHELLEQNIEENGIPNVEVLPEAVGATVGDAPFSVTDFGLDSRRSLYSAEPVSSR